jgi:ketoreductase RED2
MDLTGRAVIVTGSSSGIGAAVARRLCGLGAGIVVNSASSAQAGQRVADELADAVYVQGDIGDPATAAALVAAAEQRWGRLDGLVNNAGVTVDVPLEDVDATSAVTLCDRKGMAARYSLLAVGPRTGPRLSFASP